MEKEQFEHAKREMKNYRDLFGNELIDSLLIDSAESILDLERIINSHHDHIESMATDAQSKLSRLKQKLGLF